jgi:GTP-binding protein
LTYPQEVDWLRNNILTATAGNAVMTHRFREYAPVKGDIPERMKGSLISMEAGLQQLSQ